MKQGYSRINPYEEWKPQNKDGSGWNTTFDTHPYYYEHISPKETKLLKEKTSKLIFKVVCLVEKPKYGKGFTDHNHKNTYYVAGKHLMPFLQGFYDNNYYNEEILSIEPDKPLITIKIPVTSKKRADLK